MPSPPPTNQIAFRYRTVDSASGVARETAKRLAARLGLDETGAIHLALQQLAVKVLPQYQADDGPLSAAQLRRIKKLAPKKPERAAQSVRLSLFEEEKA